MSQTPSCWSVGEMVKKDDPYWPLWLFGFACYAFLQATGWALFGIQQMTGETTRALISLGVAFSSTLAMLLFFYAIVTPVED
jgi:hypothetical protein